MQSRPDDDELAAIFYLKDPDSNSAELCETFYRTDRDSWIVQLKKRGPRVRAQLVGLGEDETFGEMSGRTMDFFVRAYVKEHHGIDLPPRADGAAVER
ncbi:hypothetical protein [Actinocorallia sp. A-T 12471]|uniref:hypothetical protein n=1 Tax=Actinocorallia sp. A-T 12471 TaxID=3089813 RepID=UPI0029CDAEDE|nr:hypothetical protein [Actinocorallia sp. A-T 12471]MDX6740350.1 hypothetical protein [Actinocorallia sp. A-T 12471]